VAAWSTVNHREIGHLYGDRLADLPFPTRIRDGLVAAGRARPHRLLPDSGGVSRWIRGPEDVADVVALFRMELRAVGQGWEISRYVVRYALDTGPPARGREQGTLRRRRNTINYDSRSGLGPCL